MDILEREMRFTFDKKEDGEAFCKKMRDLAYKIEVVVVNDILLDRGVRTIPEGYKYGYDRKTLKKIKPEKVYGKWQVCFPRPGKLVRQENGWWAVENEESPERADI